MFFLIYLVLISIVFNDFNRKKIVNFSIVGIQLSVQKEKVIIPIYFIEK